MVSVIVVMFAFMHVGACARVPSRLCVCLCLCVCVCVCARFVCVYASADVFMRAHVGMCVCVCFWCACPCVLVCSSVLADVSEHGVACETTRIAVNRACQWFQICCGKRLSGNHCMQYEYRELTIVANTAGSKAE